MLTIGIVNVTDALLLNTMHNNSRRTKRKLTRNMGQSPTWDRPAL